MFSLITGQAVEEMDCLGRQKYQLFGLVLELEQAISGLEGLSGMGDIIMALKHDQLAMKNEYMVLEQMVQSLTGTIYDYLGCEKKVCVNTEQNMIMYGK